MAESAGLYSQNKDPVTGLTANQRSVLELMTEKKKTQIEVSEEMGISRQRVNQIVRDLRRKGYKIP